MALVDDLPADTLSAWDEYRRHCDRGSPLSPPAGPPWKAFCGR
jgi:hypothetical protein